MFNRLKLLKATLIAIFIALNAPTAYGLGMGELDLQSALNQQFQAEIELTNLRGLQIEDILPNLASQKDFDRVGVERTYILTELNFKVAYGTDGGLVVRVFSNKAIVEPYLNFLVEVLWPSGRILKEYTVLLDPPVFGLSGIDPIQETETEARVESQPSQMPESTPSETTLSETSRSETDATQSTSSNIEKIQESEADTSVVDAPAPLAMKQEGELDGQEYGVVGVGDTLWKIALKVRPSSDISVQQTMLALQRTNQKAFIKGNINLLKAGYVLRIPDASEIRADSFASAIKEVRLQNEEFAAYKQGGLAQLDATRRQSSVKADEQSESAGELKLLASNSASGERAGSGSDSGARANDLENSLSVTKEDLDRARRANTEMNVRLDDLKGQLDTLSEIVTLKDTQLAALRAELQKAQAAAEAAQAATPEKTNTQGSLSLLTSPTTLAILGGLLVVILVAGGLVVVRRRQQAEILDDEYEGEDYEDLGDSDEESAELDLDLDLDEVEEVSEEELSPETGDVIGEAEIYIAYGRFPQAITFLKNAIDAEPQRTDIQLKLLEVYVETEDSAAFNEQFETLKMLGEDEASKIGFALQEKIPGAAEDAEAMLEANLDSADSLDETEAGDDDLSFDLDDLGTESDDDALDLSDGMELSLDDLELELDLDEDDGLSLESGGDEEFSLDLDGEDELSLDTDDDEALSLDLDLDGEDELSLDIGDDDVLSLDLDLGGEDELSLDLEDDDTLSLDLDGDDALSLDLEDDEEFSLDLGDDEFSLDLGDEEFSLDLGDDDELSLDLDDDNKLDLARAYIDMGDNEGARSILNDVLKLGTDAEKKEANELLEKIV